MEEVCFIVVEFSNIFHIVNHFVVSHHISKTDTFFFQNFQFCLQVRAVTFCQTARRILFWQYSLIVLKIFFPVTDHLLTISTITISKLILEILFTNIYTQALKQSLWNKKGSCDVFHSCNVYTAMLQYNWDFFRISKMCMPNKYFGPKIETLRPSCWIRRRSRKCIISFSLLLTSIYNLSGKRYVVSHTVFASHITKGYLGTTVMLQAITKQKANYENQPPGQTLNQW